MRSAAVRTAVAVTESKGMIGSVEMSAAQLHAGGLLGFRWLPLAWDEVFRRVMAHARMHGLRLVGVCYTRTHGSAPHLELDRHPCVLDRRHGDPARGDQPGAQTH